ncbi:MAG: PQQ-like beta-propeller repeat protein [Armatimonadetes bacterium]|nr:PQQ-like beta-propeller repeat protein [Armatimonadota bacterium]
MIEHPPWRFAFRCWIALGLAALSTAASAQDPWPERQRTPNRTARADWVGPQVPVVVWKTRVDPEEFETQYRANPLLDAEGRLFVVTWRHVTALDSAGGAILWQFAAPDWVPWSPSLWRGHLLFGCVDQNFYCLDSATGTELWRVPDESFPGGQVVDSAGVVYYRSGHQNIGRRFYARRVVDGSLVWAIDTPVTEREAPSLSEDESTFFIGRPEWAQWVSRRTSDGSFVWAFQMQRDTYGSSPVENGRVYVGSPDRHDYCIDASTGQLVWRFSGEFITSNTLALADDGTVYTFHGFGRTKTFFALNPDGTEKWRIYLDSDYWVDQPPIVAGDGTIYVATRASVLRLGRVYAINPDGTILWQYDFPHYTSASPTLGPDGTLYVLCRDRNVYAFRDWERAAPTGLTVLRGLTLSGGLADLTESDDSRLVVRPCFFLTTQ